MNDTIILKTQEKIIKERNELAIQQNIILKNLKHSKARSEFIEKE